MAVVQLYVMTDKAAGASREQLHARGWDDASLLAHGLMRARNTSREYGSFYFRFTNADGVNVCHGSRTSIDPSADQLLISSALTLRDAARHDGRVFVCALVQPWQARVLRWLGVRNHG